jgi:hypothetical protein
MPNEKYISHTLFYYHFFFALPLLLLFLFPVCLSSFPSFSSSYCFSFSCLTFFFSIVFSEQNDSQTFSLKFSTTFQFHPVIRNLNAFHKALKGRRGGFNIILLSVSMICRCVYAKYNTTLRSKLSGSWGPLTLRYNQQT